VLLLGERDGQWLGLMLSSQDHDVDAEDEASYGRFWMDVGSGGWDSEGRPSQVRLDRLLVLPRASTTPWTDWACSICRVVALEVQVHSHADERALSRLRHSTPSVALKSPA